MINSCFFRMPMSSNTVTNPTAKEQLPARESVCHECDLLVAVPTLQEGEQALCPQCGNVLAHLPNNPRVGPPVFALTSIIMLMCANV